VKIQKGLNEKEKAEIEKGALHLGINNHRPSWWKRLFNTNPEVRCT
jgi:hypothetical protein